MRKQFLKIISALFLILPTLASLAQDCESTIIIILENTKGGFYQNQSVVLTSKVDGNTFTSTTSDRGQAIFKLPCEELFELSAANYTRKIDVEAPRAGGTLTQRLAYDPDMIQKQKLLAMTESERTAVDEHFKSLPDTTVIPTAIMSAPTKQPDFYAMFIITVRDLNNSAIAAEKLFITGQKRNHTIVGSTDRNGRLICYLPKGDEYNISFKYHSNYATTDCGYSRGRLDKRLDLGYLGTAEIERRRKEEALRVAAEERRIKEERARFEKYCEELGLTLEECHKREREKYLIGTIGTTDTVISAVFNRNNWNNKLIVCDVTGSMHPYAAQLALWYRLNFTKEDDLQFVLFNDGDSTSDENKKLGSTGGIYYRKCRSVDTLDQFLDYVQAKGYGGDAPENNLEAILKATKLASPFEQLVMIADNNAPVKDISLLASVKIPVKIILCGAVDQPVHPDYLKIAWKTKGSVHTIEEDITSLARLSEGQSVTINGNRYRIMGGEFVQLVK